MTFWLLNIATLAMGIIIGIAIGPAITRLALRRGWLR